MKHSINIKLFEELFAPKDTPAIGIVKDNEKRPQVEIPRPKPTLLLPYEPEKTLKECCYLAFVRVICSSYGAGDMDTFYERNSPSWCQVWFTADEVIAEVQKKGYAIRASQAKFYLRKLLADKRKLIEERTSIFRGTEYRRVRLMYDAKNDKIAE